MIINNNYYTSFRGINLKDGLLRFDASHATLTASDDRAIYYKTDDKLYWWNGTSEVDLTATASAVNHSILSSTHSDSTTGTVVRGDIITGQGEAPKWTRLALGTTGYVLKSDGTDIAWGQISNAGISDTAAIAWSKMANSTDISSTGTVTDLTISSEAAGDILYFNGTNWVRLAKDVGKFLRSDASAVSWQSITVAVANGLSSGFTLEGGTYDPVTTIASQTTGAAALTIPDLENVAQEWVFSKKAQTLENKSVLDSTFYIKDNADNTKVLQFECSEITTATTRTVTIPDASGTMTLLGNTSTGSGDIVLATSPTLITPNIGDATATSVNKVTITAPAAASTLTIADGKTLTVDNSITIAGVDTKTLTVNNDLTLAGTDDTTMTFPATSQTICGLTAAQTLSNKTLTTPIINGIIYPVASKTANYTLTATDFYVDNEGATEAITITLPSPVAGTVYVIKRVAAHTVTISPTSGTIDGAASVDLTGSYAMRMLITDGTNWFVIASM